jgi:CRISPR system Cascade subunit CasA
MNLLSDPLFPVQEVNGARSLVDLPGLFAALARDDVLDLPFLRPHQRSPWHSFCVQLGALALHRAGREALADDPDDWRALLRGLTAGWPEDEPWRLVVEDITKPAFMQPPVPQGTADPHTNRIATPDDLDVLVTSKNYGVKQGIASSAPPVTWLAALIVLQTTGGFLGAGNYGIARMNGGFATRPFVGLVPAGSSGAHWQRDMMVLLRRRDWFFEHIEGFAGEDGNALLWCLPWDGQRRLGLEELDPWFIEVCRRVRLYRDGRGGITGRSDGSSAPRIAAKELRGNVGDPWIPINLGKDSAAYNTKPRYAVMSEVLFDRNKWRRPLLLEWQDDIDRLPLLARFDVLVRGQGTTEGLHRREVPIDRERRLALFRSDADRDRLAELAREMVENAATLRNKVLKVALLTLVQGGDAEVRFRDKAASAWVERWLDEVEGVIEPAFFDHLFTTAETSDHQPWVRFLEEAVKSVFPQAIEAIPIAGVRRLKAIAVAEQKLAALFWKNFKGYLEEPTREVADGE